jgi:hypothetical protein
MQDGSKRWSAVCDALSKLDDSGVRGALGDDAFHTLERVERVYLEACWGEPVALEVIAASPLRGAYLPDKAAQEAARVLISKWMRDVYDEREGLSERMVDDLDKTIAKLQQWRDVLAK